MKKAKVAAIQMCSTSDVDKNLPIVSAAIAEAAENGAQLAILPEMFPSMGASQSTKLGYREIYGSGKIQDCIAKLAKTCNIWIIAGTIPITCHQDKKFRAASIVFDNEGNITGRYDKMHLFDVTLSATEIYNESDTVEQGEEPAIVDTPFGKIGLAVCYDIRFPELFCFYAKNGVDIISLPAAFTLKTGPHWDKLVLARAIENGCYVIGACQGGEHGNGRKTYGHSVIVNPWGEVIAKIENDQAGIIYAEIDLTFVKEVRKIIPAILDTHGFSDFIT
ncbi:MAG: carbon-nitrogen hydrolase family protein [Legionellales bacterium]|nr:carbon-nitrogen hydrolase family protein [Legionellales bacterium]